MKIQLAAANDQRKATDLFIFGIFENDLKCKLLKTFEPEFSVLVEQVSKSGRFTGGYSKTFSSYSLDYQEASEVVVFGLGKKENYKQECLRKLVGKIVGVAHDRKAKSVRVCLESFLGSGMTLNDVAGIFAEIATLSMYQFDHYKSKSDKEKSKSSDLILELLYPKKNFLAALQKQVTMHQAIGEATNITRTLINEPGNVMHPQRLAAEAKKIAHQKKISCQILGLSELKKLGMGGILGVNQGSVTPPALIILEYGKNFKKKGTICLVGKGVTFDTGGISIKPAKDMEKMKYDMSGAASVLGTMAAISDLKLPLHVVAITPAVENMVAENPQRPGDIIRMFNGKTVEVLNTDAEGRLILADALAYSEKFSPKMILDMATLTGMAAYTFGNQCCAILGNDEGLIAKVRKAGEETGERCWQLPLWDGYENQIKGHHSDLYNIGGPHGGTITAAMFLKQFVPAKTAWAHLDIAGVAWTDSPRYDGPRGSTGFGVRLLTRFLANLK